MTASTEHRLTPRQRLTRGLAQTATGPVDIARGAAGLSAHSIAAGVDGLRRRYRSGQLRRELEAAQDAIGRELAVAQGVIAALPESFQEARANRHHSRRPWLIAGAIAATLAVGGAVFAVVRRNTRQTEPSTLPPSVTVEPKI
jgi:hypothetical protein